MTPPRREYGSGGLTQRKDGIWVGTIEAGWTENNKRRRITVTSKDKATAKRKLRDKRILLERAGQQGINSRTTIKSWAGTWLPVQARRLRPKSYATTRGAVTQWIVPTIGSRRLDALTPADVRAVLARMREAGLSSSTIRRHHSVLNSLLNAAILEGHAIAPGALKVDRAGIGVNDRKDIPIEGAVALLSEAARLPHGSRWVAALLQGMRQAEALGLTWDEIDLDAGTLTISWQLQSLPYNVKRDPTSGFRVPDGYEARPVDGALCLVRPKSAKGWRVIPLVPWMVNALRVWRTIAPESPVGLVWAREDGRPIRSKDDDAEWYALQDAADIRHPSGRRYTVHEARHTTVTLLAELGVDPAVIAAIVGQAKLVESYRHVNTAPLRDALEKMAERLALPPG